MSEKKNKKPYEPPRIYDIAVDLRQAMGATNCGPGASPNNCISGPQAINPYCAPGNWNQNGCQNGTTPSPCLMGNARW